MAITYIAFIECVLQPNGHWQAITTNPDRYYPKGKDAQINLVDIKNDRRYFKFHNHDGSIKINGNVLIFDNDDADELAIDESKQFPTKLRIDETK